MKSYSNFGNVFFFVLLLLSVSGCWGFPATRLPTEEILSDDLDKYIIAYCLQYPEGRRSKTFPEDQEVVVVVSRADGSMSQIARNKLNLPNQHLSDFFIYKSGCVAEGKSISYIGNVLSWRPNSDEISYTEGSDPFLTTFGGSILSSDFIVNPGELPALADIYTRYFSGPRGVYWSPDGKKFATLALDTNNFNSVGDNIWVVDVETDKYTRITSIRESGDFIANASWSNDGTMLAIGYRKTSGIGIAQFERDSANFLYTEVTHTSNPELSEYWPYVFTSLWQLAAQKDGLDFNSYIAKTSLPVWVNNDEQIIFAASSASNQGTLFIVDSNGDNLRLLLPDLSGLIFMPTLSPNGKTLAFVRYPDWKNKSRVEIAVVDISSLAIKSLLVLPASENGDTLLVSGMSWSPDGKFLAFSSNYDGESDIYVLSANGESWTNLTKDINGNTVSPVWKP